jgi:hypothetical protein
VRYHATSRYVAWLINATGATCVDPPALYHGNNVELRWLPKKETFAGEPLPMELELTRWRDQAPSLEWWRQNMAQRIREDKIRATADVDLPDGSRTIGIPLRVDAATGADAVAILKGQLSPVESHGSYLVEVRLKDIEQGWEETVEPKTIVVVPKSWWPSVAGALRRTIPVGVLLSLALLFVYRERLKDAALTPKAPFDFAVQNAGKLIFTKPGQRKAIRLVASDAGIRVDMGHGSGVREPAALFAPVDRVNLIYRLSSRGHGWEYRQTEKDKPSGEYAPLGERGVEISFLDFVKRSTVDLRHGDHVVRICHSSYVS